MGIGDFASEQFIIAPNSEGYFIYDTQWKSYDTGEITNGNEITSKESFTVKAVQLAE